MDGHEQTDLLSGGGEPRRPGEGLERMLANPVLAAEDPFQRAIGRTNSMPGAGRRAERLSSIVAASRAGQRSGASVGRVSPPSALAEKTPSFSRFCPLSGCVFVIVALPTSAARYGGGKIFQA